MLDTPHITQTQACQTAVIHLTWDPASLARTVLNGNYEGLAAGWGEFLGSIASNGHRPAQDLWEVYAKGPESIRTRLAGVPS